MAVKDLNIQQIVGKINELPTLPDVVFKVNEVVNDPTTSAADLENVIARDQAIASKVLKLVNSAFYGLPGRVDTLSRAIPLLGFSTVRNLVMSITIFDISSVVDIDMKMFWKHAFATSVAAQTIARVDRFPDSETQSLAGLIHDIGKVVLFQYFPEHYKPVFELMTKEHITFYEAERKLYTVDHVEVGAAIADKWSFPQNLVAAIKHHHNPSNAGDLCDFVSVTAAANIICQTIDEVSLYESGYEVCAEACDGIYNLTEKSFREALREIQRQMVFFENFIDRMEVFRRPSPLLAEANIKSKADLIWKLPGKS